jgi:xylulokinase
LGIDLGTSSVKVVLTDFEGRLVASTSREYPIDTPQAGYAEQNPQDWRRATFSAIRELTEKVEHLKIDAIALAGQMHSTVLIDQTGNVVRPAIIWSDQRSAAQVNEIVDRIGSKRLLETTGTRPATGFMNATLVWMRDHEPESLDHADACISPKDYVRLQLTGEIHAEVSDASATGLFDIGRINWATDIIDELGLPRRLFPDAVKSTEVVGNLTPDAAKQLNLPSGIPIVAGCADQAAQAVGNRVLNPGNGTITIGTGGQIMTPVDRPTALQGLHTFCHAVPDRWYLLGATLSAGLSLRWLRNLLQMDGDLAAYEKLSQMASGVPIGADGLLFLPYLTGERSPIADPLASGTFVGLSLQHHQGHMARAIMEGVAFSLRHVLDSMQESGVQVETLIATGNGLQSEIWRRIVTDVLNNTLQLTTLTEQTGMGAAFIAGIGAGVYRDFNDIPTAPDTLHVEPSAENASFYETRYALYRETYTNLQSVMHKLSSSRIIL